MEDSRFVRRKHNTRLARQNSYCQPSNNAAEYLAEIRTAHALPKPEARFYDRGGVAEREYLLLRGGLGESETKAVFRRTFATLTKPQQTAARAGYLAVMHECAAIAGQCDVLEL